MGVRAVVTMPETAPAIKVAGVKRWGGEVVPAGKTSEDRRVKALETPPGRGSRWCRRSITPTSSPDRGTVGLEIAAQLPGVATVVVPVGGGGLIAGVTAGLAAAGSAAQVWGVEPAGAPKLQRSLAAGHP